MRLQVKELYLKNFKGIKEQTLSLVSGTNEIHGRNGAGKTTIVDAFNWLLFDKDSQERSQFEIKPLNFMNEVEHGLEPTVSAIIQVDDKELQLKKVYKERWEKPRGQADKVFTGNTTDYYVDGLKLKKKSEYTKVVADLLDEKVFKLLTNPRRFNELKWEERREILMKLIGGFSDDLVFNSEKSLLELNELLGDSDVEKFYELTKQKISQQNKELKNIPIRIDEANNSMVDDDFEAIETELGQLKNELSSVNAQIADASKVSDSDVRKQAAISNAKLRKNEMETEVRDRFTSKKTELSTEKSQKTIDVAVKSKELEAKKTEKADIEKKNAKFAEDKEALRQEWYQEDEKQFEFDGDLEMCPACKRPYSDMDKQEIVNVAHGHFNQEKATKLQEIQRQGTDLNVVIQINDEKIAAIDKEIESLETEVKCLNSQIKRYDDALKKYADINALVAAEFENDKTYQRYKQLSEETLEQKTLDQLDDGLEITKQDLETKIENLQERYSFKATNEKTSERIETLKADERRIANEIAKLEGHQYLCEEFTRKKVDLLDSRINEKFELVKFKMFNVQVNGGLTLTCEAMVNGVPYSNANNAAQINAGLDIIRALQQHYDFYAPIFIDNRESVNEIIDLDSQIINLSVSLSEELVVA